MSLLSFVQQRLQDLHTQANNVRNMAQRDIVAPVSHAIGNTVNAGATAARDVGGAAEATGRFVAATPNHNVVLPAVENMGKAGFHQFAVDLPKSVYDIGRGAAASLTNNQVALQHANQAKAKDEGAFLQPFARPIIQTARTIEHPFTPNSFQAHSRDAQVIFGKTPVQNVAAGVKSTYQQHANLPMPQRLLLSGAYGTGQLAQDAGAFGGIKASGHTLHEGVVDTGTKAINATKEIATNKPFRNISDSELAAANRVSMARSGYPDNTQPNDIATYRQVQQKLGVDPNNHQAVDNVIGARMTYNSRMASRPSFLQTQGGGKGTQFTNDGGLLPHQNFEKEYAQALKHMDSSMTGGQMVPDGQGGYTRTSEHSPFYSQTYAANREAAKARGVKNPKGTPPTDAQWLAEAQRQLRSGKADSYAQKEYDALKAQSQPHPAQTEHVGSYTVTPQEHENLSRAYNWNSFHPEESATRDLNSTKQYVESLYQKYAPQAEQHGRIDEFNQLFQKFKDHVRKSNADLTGKLSRVASPMVTGPAKFNFARNTARKNVHMAAVQKYLDTNKKFENQFERIARNEQAPVKVGDKGAVSATQSELQKAQEKQAAFKEINQRLRKGEPVDSVLKSYPEHVTEGLKGARSYLNTKDYRGNAPSKIPGYALTNLNATVKRLAAKAASAEKVQGASVDHLHIPGASVTIDKADNRLRIAHGEKPDPSVIKDLKSMGMRWSPRNKAWQAPVTPRLLQKVENYAKTVAPAEQKAKTPLQFGNAEQVKQAKVSNAAGHLLEQNKTRIQEKAAATPQHNATTLFDHNALLKNGGQSDIFSNGHIPVEDIPKEFSTPVSKSALTPKTENTAKTTESAKTPTASAIDHKTLVDEIKGAFTPSGVKGEDTSIKYVLKHPEEVMRNYDQRVMKEFGTKTPNVVAGDEAKFVVSHEDPTRTKLDAAKSSTYHEPASAIAKVKYKQLLSDPKTQDKPVLIMAGGSGAGKTSSLRSVLAKDGKSLDDYAAIIDTNSNNFSSARSKINQALGSGRNVDVHYVYRDIHDAFVNGVVPRSKNIGRIVPLHAHMETHLGSRAVMNDLASEFKGNPHVNIKAVDNSRGSGKSVSVPLDKIPDMRYNSSEIQQKLEGAIHDLQKQGTISKAEHDAYLEGTRPAQSEKLGTAKQSGSSSKPAKSTGNEPSAIRQPEPQRQTTVNKPAESINARRVPDIKNALKQSTRTDRPTAISDALLAKQAKLEAAKSSAKPANDFTLPAAKSKEPLPIRPRGKTASAPSLKAKTVETTPTAVAPEGNKLSRFANVTVQNSDKVEPSVKKLVDEKAVNYTPQQTKAGQAAAQAFVKQSGNIDKATSNVISNLHTSEAGKITRQDVFNAQAVADKLQKTGKAEDAGTAAEIYGALSAHHTAAGQQIQAAAALAKQSPQGLHQLAIKAIQNGGKKGATQKISEDVAKQVSDKVDQISKAPEGSTQRDDHIQELQKIVNQNVHHSLGSKVFALWRTGLLTGPQTMTKVALSHAIMAGAEKLKDIPAVAIDKAISGGSRLMGKGPMRSTALTLRGEGSGFKTGTAAGVKLLRTGLDTKGTGGLGDTLVGKLAHPEVDYGNSKLGKAANFYVQKTGGVHAAIPKGFFTAAQSNDLFKQAIAEGKTKGLKGADLQSHVDNYVQGASDFAKQEAQLSAQRASFQQETALGRVGQAMQHVPGGKVVLPFAKIASTILNDAVDYSPAGALKAGWQAFKESKGGDGWTPTVQKHFVEELGRSITGTGAIIAGAELYKHGVMTLGYPTSKPEQQQWKAEGKTPNSILINGKWRDTASLGPFGTLLFMGGSVAESGGKDAKGRSQAGAAATGAIQNITSQSYLSGLTSAANALSDPKQFAGSEEKQLAGSVVPIAVATTARATDSKQRNTPGVAQSVESKIPGLREKLTPQQDEFGRTLNRQGGVAANLFDPSRPSGQNAGPQVKELDRLLKTTGNSAVPQPVKSINGTDANGNKTTTALTQVQQNAFSAAAGPKIQAAYKQMMNDPRYKQLTDANKVSALNAAKTSIEDQQKATMLKSINGGTVKLTAAQKAGQIPDYLQTKLNEQSGGSAGSPINAKLDSTSRNTLNKYNGMTAAQRKTAAYTDNSFDFKYAQAKYNNDVLNNSLTTADKIKAQASLAKDQVGTAFNKNVRDLYGLSNAELTNYLSTSEPGVDKQALASQIIAYGDALAKAGVEFKNKFRNSKGAITLGDSSSTGGGGRSTRMKLATIPKIKNNPYRIGSTRNDFKQRALPKVKSAVSHSSYKTPSLKSNISSKLRKA